MGENIVLGSLLILPTLTGCLLLVLFRRVRRRNAPASWPTLLLGNSLLLVFLLSLMWLAGEVYYRFLYDSTDSLMFTKVSQRWFVSHYHWNKANLRDDFEYSLRIAPGKRRISFVGDSFTVGHGIKRTDARFSNLVRARHPEWEIHVMAMLGFDTGDELTFLSDWLAKGYQVDEVVLVYCLNDIGDLIPEQRAAVTRINEEAKHGSWLRQNSYLVNTIYYRIRLRYDKDLGGYYGYVRDAYRDGPLWTQQMRRLTAFRDLVASHGGRLAVVTFPFMHALGPDYEYEFVHEKLDKFWDSINVPNLDLLPLYRHLSRKQLTVNHFDAHPSEYANALAAPAIDKFLAAQIAPKPNPQTNSEPQPASASNTSH
jgi:hypothetical protein